MSKKISRIIFVMNILALFILAGINVGCGIGEPPRTSEKKVDEIKPTAKEKDQTQSKQREFSFRQNTPESIVEKNDEYIKTLELNLKDILVQINNNIKDQKDKIDWGKYIFGVAIFSSLIAIVSLIALLAFNTITLIKKMKDNFDTDIKGYKEQIKEITVNLSGDINQFKNNIDDRVALIDKNIMESVDNKLREDYFKFSEKANRRIVEYLEDLDKDFSLPLEERYLSMEYVYLDIWERISEEMMVAWGQQDSRKFFTFWNKLYVTQLALRQTLSGDQQDVFTGMGSLRAIASEGLVSVDILWEFISVLKKQGRLSPENLALARELGRDIGKTFRDRAGA
jgi:hypothetical protein